MLNANPANFQLHHGENKLVFNAMMSPLCTKSTCLVRFS